jgi:hypothetical protein
VGLNKWLGTHSIKVPDMGQMDDTETAVIQKR